MSNGFWLPKSQRDGDSQADNSSSLVDSFDVNDSNFRDDTVADRDLIVIQ